MLHFPQQDPVTGICYDDILVLDTKIWEWSVVEVGTPRTFLVGLPNYPMAKTLRMDFFLIELDVYSQVESGRPPARHSHCTGLFKDVCLVSTMLGSPVAVSMHSAICALAPISEASFDPSLQVPLKQLDSSCLQRVGNGCPRVIHNL